jgi:hypothetical protein
MTLSILKKTSDKFNIVSLNDYDFIFVSPEFRLSSKVLVTVQGACRRVRWAQHLTQPL